MTHPHGDVSEDGGELGARLAGFQARIRTYLTVDEAEFVESAYHFSALAHQGQLRKSGEPYISHPLAVAVILADWQLDPQALAAALLHDVVEDTTVTMHDVQVQFGDPIAALVDGLSKLDRIEFQSQQEVQAENFRKMLLAMARDIRIILIKLADRLHNMRTLGPMSAIQQRRIARETLEIYAPIANRIGLNRVYQELDELAFQFLYPFRYRVLTKAVNAARGNRRRLVDKIRNAIQQKLTDAAIEANVCGREKNLYSIYKKMHKKHLTFSEVLDIYGFRVTVKDNATCYLALGLLHALYNPVPGKFKDYVAIAKANGYQSLHTTLFGPYGTPIEVQIRTLAMHEAAEVGLAAHWVYKSPTESVNDTQHRTYNWLQRLLDIQSTSRDAVEFLEHIKVDLFPDEVYAFTPKGRIFALPQGATVLDFAYAVHTDIGAHCAAARINYELMPLRTRLRNGDRVEIMTDPHIFPNPAWLSFVTTPKARTHIRHYLKTSEFSAFTILGQKMLTQALRVIAPQWIEPSEAAWEQGLRHLGLRRDEVLAEIGIGKQSATRVAKALLHAAEGMLSKRVTLDGEHIRNQEGMQLKYAPCCYPIPNDAIIGVRGPHHLLMIHTANCVTARTIEAGYTRCEVTWGAVQDVLFEASVRVVTKNIQGALAQITAAIASKNVNITHIRLGDFGREVDVGVIGFVLQVAHRQQLAQVMHVLRALPVVKRLQRRHAVRACTAS